MEDNVLVPFNIENADLAFIALTFASIPSVNYKNYRDAIVQLSRRYIEDYTFGFDRKSPLSLFDFWKLLYKLRLNRIDTVKIQTTDFHSLALTLSSKLLGIEVVYYNHDAVAHEGYGLIRRVAISIINGILFRLSDEILFFSDHNKTKAIKKHGTRLSSSMVIELPSIGSLYPIKKNTRKLYDLVIFGRNEVYKIDRHLLSNALNFCKRFGLRVVIAGRLSENSFFNTWPDLTRKGYLQDADLIELLDSCKAGLLPYISCSQSGVLSLLESRQVAVFCSKIDAFENPSRTNARLYLDSVDCDMVLSKFFFPEKFVNNENRA